MNILFVMTVIGIIMGFIFQKNRAVTIYNSVLMWMITGWQYNTADYYNYNRIFLKSADNISLSFFGQPIYYLINLLVKKCNGNFQMVYIICGLIAVVTLVIGIQLFTDRVNLVISFFMISAFLLYAVQIRNFVAISFILVATSYIVGEGKNILKFVVLVLIASGFHVTALFYLILLLIPYLNTVRTLILTAALCVGACYSTNMMSWILTSIGMLDYTASSHDTFTIMVYNVFSGVIILITIYLCYLIEKNKEYYLDFDKESGKSTIDFSRAARQIASLMLVCIPLQFVTIEAVRLCRNLFPLFFCVIARLYPLSLKINIRAIKSLELYFGIIVIAMIGYSLLYGDLYIYRQCYKTVLIPLFENNLLIN